MRILQNKLRKVFIILVALSIWLYWDLSQARSVSSSVYKSFFLDSDRITLPPSYHAAVSIVRSNDPSLGTDTCGVTSEGITSTTISKMVKRAVDLAGGLSNIIHSGDTVLIKPNIVHRDSSGSGGVTDIRVVKALVYLIDSIDHGNIKIIVGEGSPVPFTTFEKSTGTSTKPWNQSLYDLCGYQQLKSEAINAGINFRLSNLNGNSNTDPWQELDTAVVPGGGYSTPQGGKYFVHHDVIHASVYITVPVMKIHQQTGFTCALKNQIGLAASTRYGFNKTTGVSQENKVHKLNHYFLMESSWHNWQDKEVVDLAVLAKIKFVVVDAITCLESKNGPIFPTYRTPADSFNTSITNRIKMNTIIAGYDPVAVDNACCRIMMLNPDDIEHITLAERAGLGTNDPEKITVLGTTIDQTKRLFKKCQNPPIGGEPATTNISLYGQGNRTWLLSNYYRTSGISNPMDYQFISNEATLAPTAGANGWSLPIYFTDDQILVDDYLKNTPDSTKSSQAGVSYAFTYFTVPNSQQAELWIGSDEDLKIYLNGTVVYNYRGTRIFDGNEVFKDDTTIINLQAGLNSLLVKLYQSTGRYSFSLNICEIQPNPLYKGNRVMGLKFVTTGVGTSVNEKNASTISSFELKNNYPNPFNPSTVIRYQLSAVSQVRLSIFDMLGREVATLVNEQKSAGSYSVPWNASNISSGVYFYKLTAGNFSQVKKMVLAK